MVMKGAATGCMYTLDVESGTELDATPTVYRHLHLQHVSATREYKV